MIETREGEEAWCPLILISSASRTWLAWWMVHVASQETCRSGSIRPSTSRIVVFDNHGRGCSTAVNHWSSKSQVQYDTVAHRDPASLRSPYFDRNVKRASGQEQSALARESVPVPIRQVLQHLAAYPEQISGLRDRQDSLFTFTDREAQGWCLVARR